MPNHARLSYYAARGNWPALGWWLRRSLSVSERRRLALAVLRDEPLTLRFDAGGFSWEVPVGDEITRELFADGGYGAEHVEMLHARFGTGTVLEIGANVGTCTVPFAALGWDVIAVEPVPALHACLATNVERNGLADRVTLVEAAIAGERGRMTMVLPAGTYGSSHLYGFGVVGDGGDQIEVATLTLDDLSLGDVSLVWCDAEGSEGLVIEQGASLWARGVPLYVELSAQFVPLARQHFDAFVREGETHSIDQLAVDTLTDVLLLQDAPTSPPRKA